MLSLEGFGPLVRIIGDVNANMHLCIVQNVIQSSLQFAYRKTRAKDYFIREGYEVMELPAQNMDFNTIENLWKIIANKVRKLSRNRIE